MTIRREPDDLVFTGVGRCNHSGSPDAGCQRCGLSSVVATCLQCGRKLRQGLERVYRTAPGVECWDCHWSHCGTRPERGEHVLL